MLKCGVCGSENKVQDTCAKCGSTIQRIIKAIPLKDIYDVSKIKEELSAGNVLIVNITPFIGREGRESQNFSKMRKITSDLANYALSIDGDVARIGNERLVLAPSSFRIKGSGLRKHIDNNL